jgi:hypothetical protein
MVNYQILIETMNGSSLHQLKHHPKPHRIDLNDALPLNSYLLALKATGTVLEF